MNTETIKKYYDNLASDYDADRFGNSYGSYIDGQEKSAMQDWSIPIVNQVKILDLACGTGRFLDFASHGSDISSAMVEVAQTKFPLHQLVVSDAKTLPFESGFFEQIHAFHLFMHLPKDDFMAIVQEVKRALRKDGIFIFDIPSEKRRNLLGYTKEDWHGATSYSLSELKGMFGADWELTATRGVLIFPIHHIPKFLRTSFLALDNWLCRSLFKEYASYLLVKMQKKCV